ncbi:hypothetical protein D3C71_1478660 [compost metagenome]
MDGARGAAVAAGQHLHQGTARPVLSRHEVRQADDPLTSERQLAQGLAATGPQGRGDGESVPLFTAEQRPVVEVIGVQKAEQLVARQQVSWLARGAARLQIVGGREQPQLGSPERQSAQGGVRQLADANGHVHPPLHQVDEALGAVQLQLDPRIAAAKLADDGHQPVQDEGGGGVDPQHPFGLFPAHQQMALRLAHLGQHLHRPLIEPAPLLGQADPPRGAVEQHGGELLFEALDAAAHHRVVHAEVLRRLAKTARLHHGHKQGQFIGMGLHCCHPGKSHGAL